MLYKGKIKELNQIIISDPSYDKSVDCRYEQTNIDGKNLDVDIEIHDYTEKYHDIQVNGIEFFVLIHKPELNCNLNKDGSYSHYKDDNIVEKTIGIDTACIAFGVNKYADLIRDNIDEWQPDVSLKTLSDGIFGYVHEGKNNSEINYIWMSGFLDSDTQYSIEDVLDYICNNLEITDLCKEVVNTKFTVINNDMDYDM